MIQKRVLEEFNGVIKVFKNNEIEDKIILSFIDTNFDFLKENKEFETEFFKVGDGISVTKRKKQS